MLSRTCLIALLLAASASISALATTYVVNPNGTGDFPTIQAAIDGAIDGDIIEFTDGTFTGDGNRDIDWGHNTITVRSQSGNALACVIDCQGSAAEPHRGFICSEEEAYNSLLQGISIINGYADRGGAILFWEAIQVENCVFSNNTATDGGAFAGVSSAVPDVCSRFCLIGVMGGRWNGEMWSRSSDRGNPGCWLR